MKKVAIIGASGYTGRELIKILFNHPEVEISHITSENNSGKKLEDVHKDLKGFSNLVFEKYEWNSIKDDTDILFLALPHGTSMNIAKEALDNEKIVIDLSADFRIKDPGVYNKWYDIKHQQTELLKDAVYGLPELYRDNIKKTRLVANPGCYSTAIILGIYPLLAEGVIDIDSIIVDAKSGVSGAGKKLAHSYLYNEANENFLAYNPGFHRHTPEIEEILGEVSGKAINITFVPHLVPMTRGILAAIYMDANSKITNKGLNDIFKKYYDNEFFIRLLPENNYPATKNVTNSNFCDIGFTYIEKTNKIIVLSAIDNLVKGASGQAVQNMNIICNFKEQAGFV